MAFSARIKKIYAYRAVLWEMSLKQLKGKYSGSMLGLWWAVIIPVILAFSINFIFTQVFKAQAENYAFFILAGMVPWAFFSGTLMGSAEAFFAQSSILKQGTFPREFVVISAVLADFISFCTGFLFLYPVFIFLEPAVIHLLPAFFCLALLYLMFVAGLSLLCSVANVFFRDTAHFLSIALMFWFWITPIFYSLETLGLPWRRLFFYNPLTYFILAFQSLLFKASLPSAAVSLTCLATGVFFLAAGYFVFLKFEPKLMKRI
ncbi:MAG TPA: hypothetical protein DCL35_01855 [Candidatus Omnitrophica bacterium]|nr:hypothetical protein [Candidatus Omnitrophota bacterium]